MSSSSARARRDTAPSHAGRRHVVYLPDTSRRCAFTPLERLSGDASTAMWRAQLRPADLHACVSAQRKKWARKDCYRTEPDGAAKGPLTEHHLLGCGCAG